MSLSLAQISRKLLSFRGLIVDSQGRMSSDFKRLINEIIGGSEAIETDVATVQADVTTVQADVTTAQASADNSGAYWVNTPSSQAWNTDTAGVHEAGNPTQDILFTLYNKAGSAIATRTLRGTMTSASGNITVSETGTPTGLTTTVSYDPANNADPSVKADVVATFADGSRAHTSAAFSSVDLTAAGGTPGSGGGK